MTANPPKNKLLLDHALSTARQAGFSGEDALLHYAIDHIPWVKATPDQSSQYIVSDNVLSQNQRMALMALNTLNELVKTGRHPHSDYTPRPRLDAKIAEARGEAYMPATDRPLPRDEDHAVLTKRALPISVHLTAEHTEPLLEKALAIVAAADLPETNHFANTPEWKTAYGSLDSARYRPLVDYAARKLPWQKAGPENVGGLYVLNQNTLTPDQRTVLEALIRCDLVYHPTDPTHQRDYLPRPPLQNVMTLIRSKRDPHATQKDLLTKHMAKREGYDSIDHYVTFALPWQGTDKNPLDKTLDMRSLSDCNQALAVEYLKRKGKIVAVDAAQQLFNPTTAFQEEMLTIAHDKLVQDVKTHLGRS